MPGNEFGDRVHNFFAQDNAFQGQPESQVVEGNWPVLNNNFWIGSHRQADALHSNNKTYNLQDPDIDRGQSSYPFHVTQGLNFVQSSVRADFSKNQSQNEQTNLNGYMFGNQFQLSRQNEANFLSADTDTEPHHAIPSRGFSVHELQQGGGIENGAKTSLRSETSMPSVSLDLFGGQQQISHHQSSMLQPVQHQHPGINNMQQQQQQQQLMIKKMQDLQRQQQFQPLEIRQQNYMNQIPPVTKQASGSHSTAIDGNPVSDLQHHGDIRHVSSDGKVSAQLPETEKVDGTTGFFQQNQSSVYQGFGLQLGPPSLQQGKIVDHPASSQRAQNTVNSMPISHAAPEMGEKGQQMVPTSTIQSLNFPNGESRAELKTNKPAVPPSHTGGDERHRNFQEAFSSGSPHMSQLQNQQLMRSSGKIMMNQHVDSSFSSDVSNNMQRESKETALPDTPGDIQKPNVMSSRGLVQQAGPNDAHDRGPTSTTSTRESLHTSQHFSMHGISHQGSALSALHDLATNVYTNQHSLGTQYQKASHFSDLNQSHTGESSSAPLSQGSMNACKGGSLPSDLRSVYVNSHTVVDGEDQRLKESAGQSLPSVRVDTSNKNNSDNSPSDLSSTQKNIEAFGRSLKPNSLFHLNYVLLDQLKAMKDAGLDPSCRVSKKMKGPDDCLDVDRVASTAGQQNDHSLVLGDSLGSSTGVPSDDLRMPSFLLASDAVPTNPSQHGNVASQDILSRGANVSNSSTDYTTSVRSEYPEVSPQMAPSWFNQYGAFKNGQLLQSYNAHKLIPSKSGELGKSPSVMDTLGSEEKGTDAPPDASQVNTTHQTSTSTFANEPLSSGRSYELNATDQNLVMSRPKKRKTDTSQLQPWHQEITDGSQNLSTLSVAETVWSQVANRLNEKVDDDAELIEDGPPFLRSKRRLILTTQLMQQLFYPPPAAILSGDANFKCEGVAYAVSRNLLGNVCSAVFRSSGLDLPHEGVELLSAKGESLERNVDCCSGKVMEGLMGRFGKLENDFLRLEKSSSIFDVRMECQDLEKFSVINRLAKFHGRAPTDGPDTAPSHKPLPQRYVAAIPMPRSLPDSVQCLSL
ncbi:hypothetical protein F511_02187 [Dorcoceras hygrometricum]|uniref:Uncharacterized protein n=1 Tax=Dorcoceras hygrometricum TaxID=472368 RepID=A0A2Z7APD5_9LAMI|nr:hypothetical protein F511_02187 [Dorcoceras hygrometricum]